MNLNLNLILLNLILVNLYLSFKPAPRRYCFAPCKRNYDPVCGASGKTYDNHCILTCESRDHFKHKGRCKKIHHPNVPAGYDCRLIRCARNTGPYHPVCGKKNLTYKNVCDMCGKGDRFKHKGACPSQIAVCLCPAIYAQVCGVDGKTYSSNC